ncbi:MAG: LamG-like jellyroll fold domain-containing protein, partial [Actinomycetota bacterium]
VVDGGELALTVTECLTGACTTFGPTSELSLAVTTPTTATVNSTGDGGDSVVGDGYCWTGGTNSDGDDECTLRAAIDEANASADVDTIHFAIPNSDVGYSGVSPTGWTIQPATSLPTITSPTTVDGSTQTGFVGAPLIALDGSVATGTGLVFSGGNSTLRSLALHSFNDGVQLTTAGGNNVAGVWIGLLLDGTTSAPLVDDGIKLEPTSPNNTIGGPVTADRNVIAGSGVFSNNTEGIYVRSNGNVIEGNFLGTDSTGLLDRGYDDEAIDIANSSDNIVRDNVVAFNAGGGMQLSSTTRTTIVGNLIGVAADGVTPAGNGFVGIETISTNSDAVIGGTSAGDRNVIAHSGQEGLRIRAASSTTVTLLGNEIRDNGALGIDLADAGDPASGVTPNDLEDGDIGSNGLLNFPVLGAPVAGESSLGIDLDVPAGDYRIEVFTNPSGTDPSGYGEGENLIHAETVTSTGAVGDESFTLTGLPVLASGQVLTATATPDLGGGSFGGTSEFAQAATVAPAGGVLDRSVRRHDLSAFGGLDTSTPGSGITGDGFDLAGGGERLSGPAFDPTDGAITMSGWVSLTSLSGESAVVAKTGSGGTIHELIVDGSTGEAVARILVGASTIEARGGSVSTGTWHQLAAAWDGADLRLYVDGAQVDSTAAVGTLGDDRSIPVTVGDTSIQSAALVGSVDQVVLGRTARSADQIATEYLNLSDPTGMISVGAPQTEAPGSWTTTTSTTRTGSHALDAPNVTSGASPWLVAAGLDEPGLAFESWWYLTDPSAAATAAGTNTQDPPTDQREVRADVAGVDLATIEGATRTVDATDGTTIGTAVWTKVEIRTDETGTSSVLLDGTQVIAPTAHSAGTSSGSAAFRVETLPGGDSWLVDDVRVRRLVSDEPSTSLAPLHRQ